MYLIFLYLLFVVLCFFLLCVRWAGFQMLERAWAGHAKKNHSQGINPMLWLNIHPRQMNSFKICRIEPRRRPSHSGGIGWQQDPVTNRHPLS